MKDVVMEICLSWLENMLLLFWQLEMCGFHAARAVTFVAFLLNGHLNISEVLSTSHKKRATISSKQHI